MNSLEQSLEKLNNNLINDFNQSKSVYEEAVTNHCSDHTQNQLFNKGLIKSKSYFIISIYLSSSNGMV
jgi:hypothetical protein